jgi:lipoate-protein ligase A
MLIKKFENYQLITEDEDEREGSSEYVPKKVIKWFRNLGVNDYLSAIQDLRSKGYIITEDPADYNDLEGS